jgi:hypothetical protein
MPANDDKFLPGDRVLALRKSGARYLATVATSNRDGSYSVRWDSGETRESRQSPTSLTRISQNNGGSQDDDSCAVRQACRTTTAKIPVRSTKAEEDALLASLGCRLTAAQLLALPRYVRLVQGKRTTITASTLRDELNAMGVAPGEVDHTPLPDFFALPAELSIAPLASHRSCAVVGQDLSSGVAVRVLLSEVVLHNTSCHVLELCCAPGGKLLYTAEVLLQSSTAGKANCGDRTVTGTPTPSPECVRSYLKCPCARDTGTPLFLIGCRGGHMPGSFESVSRRCAATQTAQRPAGGSRRANVPRHTPTAVRVCPWYGASELPARAEAAAAVATEAEGKGEAVAAQERTTFPT